jgi:hypothetical protein
MSPVELKAGLERAKRQKKQWDKLENLTSNVHSRKVAYEDMCEEDDGERTTMGGPR